jgi:hypothetical protein
MRTPLLLLSSLLLLAACDDKKPAADTSAASATAATSAPATTIVPPAMTASAAPSASAQPSASAASPPADAKPMFGCKTKVGDAKLDVEVYEVPKASPVATVKVDAKSGARSFKATTQPHAATYTLVFSGYGESDKHAAAEPAYVAGTTVLGRLVANGDKMEFFADKGFPTHPAKDGPYVCEK